MAAFACAIWSPWTNWDSTVRNVLGIETQVELARLQVSSLAGEVEIYVDDELRGSVGPEGSPFLIEDIEPGQRSVRLVRTSETSGSYIDFNSRLNFSPEIDTVIAYELGPTEQFSEGHIITAYDNFLEDTGARLSVRTEPAGASITLDGQPLGSAPVENYALSLDRPHEMRLTKEGYEELVITLLPQEQEARDQLEGFDIAVEARLFLIPLDLDFVE